VLSAVDGTTQQGAYAELHEKGFISTVSRDYAQLQQIQADEPEKDLEAEFSKIATGEEARDLTRQTGDLTIYQYYFSSVGVVNMLIFFGFVVMNAFSSSFSRKVH
jgi:hypothetical protein